MADLKPLIKKALSHITAENWTNAVNHAEKLQGDDASRDVAIDNFVDSFIITLDSSDEEEL